MTISVYIRKSVLPFLMLVISCGSYAGDCYAQASGTRPVARKFDEFTDDGYKENCARIERFAIELKRNPSAQAYVFGYTPRVLKYGNLKASQVAFYAASCLEYGGDNSIDTKRIVKIDGGLRDAAMIELYIVPPGARPPVPTPTFPQSALVHCPLITVSAPEFVWDATRPLSFSVSARHNDLKATATYQWIVSAGEIISGQGTPEIKVTLKDSSYQSVKASVAVGGFSSQCEGQDFAVSPTVLTIMPLKFDEFGDINCEEELARLDNLAVSMMNETDLQARLIVYGGRYGKRNEARARAARMKYYMVKSRGLNPERIITVDGGYREEHSSELWLSPKGGSVPVATPNVDAKSVKFTGTLRVRGYYCGEGLG